jgi:hypothetical protein
LIVGRASKEGSLRGAIAASITTPLGMSDTAFVPRAGAETATPYKKARDTKPAKLWHLGASEGSGGLWSTLDDMAKYVAFELSAWPARADADGGPLARRTLREMHIAAFPIALDARVEQGHVKAESSGVGFAWHAHTTCAYESLVEHDGAIDGFRASVGFAPERGFGFVVLTNALDARTGRLQDQLFDAAAGVLAPRVQQADPKLVELVQRLVPTLATCDLGAYDAMFADSFHGAVPRDEYARTCEEKRSLHGTCTFGNVVTATDPRNVEVLLKCERGAIDAHASIAVGDDGKARFDTFAVEDRDMPLAPELARTIDEVLATLGSWDAAKYRAMFARPEHEAEMHAGSDKVYAQTGACKRRDDGPTLAGDGRRRARVALSCERGPGSDIDIAVDAAGKIELVLFQDHRAAAPSKPQRCR